MSLPLDQQRCDQADLVSAYALHALPADEAAAMEAHVCTCVACRHELESLRPVIEDSFVDWPTDILRPQPSLWDRLANRIAEDTGEAPVLAVRQQAPQPEWEQVAPGISCKLLATDTQRARVSMLVRLAPGIDYPPHSHAGVEELHLLDGELWIEDRKLVPGDYNHASPGTGDQRVFSETGCTCVLVTSTADVLR